MCADQGESHVALERWNSPANGGPGADITYLATPTLIDQAVFEDYAMLYVPSAEHEVSDDGLEDLELAALNARSADVLEFVSTTGGGVLALTEEDMTGAWAWVPAAISTVDQANSNVRSLPALYPIAPNATNDNLDHGVYHEIFTAFPATLDVFIETEDPSASPILIGGLLGPPISQDGNGDGIPDECMCAEDVTGDFVVDVGDLLAVLAAWGPCTGACPEDIDGSGAVDVGDLLAILADWGPCAGESTSPPTGIIDCYQRYSGNIEKLEACLETMVITGSP